MICANDTQMLIDFDPGDRQHAVCKMQDCLDDVHSWSSGNKLILNGHKTELLHITSKFKSRNQDLIHPLRLLQVNKLSTRVRQQGV